MNRHPASFRDPSGSVYVDGQTIYRSINALYVEDWEHVRGSGLLEKAMKIGGMSEVREVPVPEGLVKKDRMKFLQAERVPFVSYPYEWSFSQLKDAALLTLGLQRLALEHDCVLKDASAYNVLFNGSTPVFIDILSFEKWRDERPWEAYAQFCRHFLAPLALQAYVGPQCGLLSRQWIDGVPLDLTCAMLPGRARLSLGLTVHLFMHSKMQTRHADGHQAGKAKTLRMTRQGMLDITDSLQSAVAALKPPSAKTEWGDYYEDTNYTAEAMRAKENIVVEAARSFAAKNERPELAVDLGANNGRFSHLIAPYFSFVVASDIDPAAVEAHYLQLKKNGQQQNNVLPLIQDLTSPSPALGWNLRERASLIDRARADMVLALALCHHLHFTGGIPFAEMATFFKNMLRPGGLLLVEFVPADDSQVKRLLAARSVNLEHYTLESFSESLHLVGLKEISSQKIPGSGRTLLQFIKQA